MRRNKLNSVYCVDARRGNKMSECIILKAVAGRNWSFPACQQMAYTPPCFLVCVECFRIPAKWLSEKERLQSHLDRTIVAVKPDDKPSYCIIMHFFFVFFFLYRIQGVYAKIRLYITYCTHFTFQLNFSPYPTFYSFSNFHYTQT